MFDVANVEGILNFLVWRLLLKSSKHIRTYLWCI